MRKLFALGFAIAMAGQVGLQASATVGSKAPPVEPKEWLNSKEPVSWSKLKGRVILVEKWGTY